MFIFFRCAATPATAQREEAAQVMRYVARANRVKLRGYRP
jgi:hypothetical protein